MKEEYVYGSNQSCILVIILSLYIMYTLYINYIFYLQLLARVDHAHVNLKTGIKV